MSKFNKYDKCNHIPCPCGFPPQQAGATGPAGLQGVPGMQGEQ
ncbi:collagen-like protein, partial [Klebsiella pneumoniae]|nr:collagen-like protein [Klebsiella pneumoniae]